MFLNLMFLFIIIILSNIVMKMSTFLSKKNKLTLEKMSPFECGFDPMNLSRIPFSIRFFLISIIFLIFDVEIALVLPFIPSMYYSSIAIWFMSSLYFILILIFGVLHEWIQGALNWLFFIS